MAKVYSSLKVRGPGISRMLNVEYMRALLDSYGCNIHKISPDTKHSGSYSNWTKLGCILIQESYIIHIREVAPGSQMIHGSIVRSSSSYIIV